MDDMRKRLIELVQTSPYVDVLYGTDEEYEYVADHLIENGVILPPCKVGDTVYYPWEYGGQNGVAFNEVESIKIYCSQLPIVIVKDWESDIAMPISFTLKDFGKTVFLTKEEAEEHLQKGIN